MSDALHQCHRCREADFSAKVAVCIDGRPIEDHADSGYCPHPRGPVFGTCQMPAEWPSEGLGDAVAKLIPGAVGAAYKRVVRRVTGKGCNCGKRRDGLNRLLPFK